MKFLVIGLGSMGKRRIRNLLALGYNKENIAGFDPRKDRIKEAEKYIFSLYDDFTKAVNELKPNIIIVSTPPNYHMEYAYYAQENDIHCFIEASVVDADKILKLHEKIKNKNILIAPSCTMRYYPAPKKIKELINSGTIGKVLNYNYHTGQYLPDWHPWENIEDFYVSKRETGGCREIVPFEMTWLNDIFGNPKPLACVKRKLTDIPANIDDIYHCILEYPNNIIGNLTVEVISRPKATREFRVLGTKGEITFSGDNNTLKYITTDMNEWESVVFDQGTIEKQYINPEEPYIDELNSFIKSTQAVENKQSPSYKNTLLDDYNVLRILYELEKISEVSK